MVLINNKCPRSLGCAVLKVLCNGAPIVFPLHLIVAAIESPGRTVFLSEIVLTVCLRLLSK